MIEIVDKETAALIEVGWIRKIDGWLLGGLVLSSLATLALFYFSCYRAAFFCGFAAWLLQTCWIISLAYRASYFILKTRAVIETLPENAGKIAADILTRRSAVPRNAEAQEALK